MFVMKRERFFDYCEWLFSILKDADKKIDVSNYNIDEKRAIGRIAEWLLGIYYVHLLDTEKNIKTKEVPIILIDEQPYKISKFENFIRKIQLFFICFK